jgi:hypothetical protein
VYAAGPRVERRFLDAVAKLDDRSVPIAETYRRARELAEQMGVPRPSYERIRCHLRTTRITHEERYRARDLLFQLAYNTRRADDVLADLLELLE